MSSLGKILLWVALLGAFADGFAGWLAISKYNVEKVAHVEAQQAQQVAVQATKKAKQEADAANEAKAQAETELSESKNKLDDLNAKLATAQKGQDDLKAAVQTANDNAKKAQDDLQHVHEVLNMTPEEAKAAIQKAQDDLTANQSEQKILQDQLQATVSQINDLKDAINRSKVGAMPPGISGKVTFVNRAWNFVVLNVGLSNGIVPNGELIIYRGNNFLGKIKVTSAEANTAVADILPDAKADIQIGDNVLN